ncbi:MAG: phenylacetate--CoA ligase family protein [Theionarchaea archaeon]|nr:phenylacetate--CoA ligase family protein [Theionarchaea archaeon]
MLLNQVYYILKSLKMQWKNPEDIAQMQKKQLKNLISHAYDTTGLYHRKFKEAGVSPTDFRRIEDIVKFPFITKSDARESYPDQIVSRDCELSTCLEGTTSGSTGQNLTIAYSPEAYQYYMAATYRNFSALGFKPWDRFAYTRYAPIKIGTPLYERLGFVRKKHISVFLEVEQQVALLTSFNPTAITGYPSMMMEWAKIMNQTGNTIHPLFIRAEAEILTRETKDFMGRVFECNLYEEYGSAEFVHIAFECPRGGFHISSDTVFLEFLDDDEPVSPGEEGEIYITSLVNYAMPLIRYKINDRGIALDERCSCGRGLPLMKLVVGRDDDFIVLPSGRRVTPRAVIPLLEFTFTIKEFMIIQKRRDYIEIEIIPGPEYSQEEETRLRGELLGLFGEPVTIKFTLCEEIPRGRHNRPRPIQSLVT